MHLTFGWAVAVAAIVVSAAGGPSAQPSPAPEKLDIGSTAPAAVGQSVFGGKVEKFDLAAAAAKRPVVLYFFPQAFSEG